MPTKLVVVTGGPCAGKSTVLSALEDQFPGLILTVPEAATMLFKGGFLLPGRDLPWSSVWQDAFQGAVVGLQEALEATYLLKAEALGTSLLVCDRGILDGAAYTAGGLAGFSRRYGIIPGEEIARYDAILHLESLATGQPELYGKTGNEARFESVEEAAEREMAVREAWAGHPRRSFIGCDSGGVVSKISRAAAIVAEIINE